MSSLKQISYSKRRVLKEAKSFKRKKAAHMEHAAFFRFLCIFNGYKGAKIKRNLLKGVFILTIKGFWI